MRHGPFHAGEHAPDHHRQQRRRDPGQKQPLPRGAVTRNRSSSGSGCALRISGRSRKSGFLNILYMGCRSHLAAQVLAAAGQVC